ncbi:UNVERIFIED_CONTAM: hypothetical protein N8J90_11700 [Halobacillus marinus]|uniref:hypothetical protein n=1 Tax=Halobacillus sp. BAB-2008 TaxID=1246484 RepID=UPI0002A4F11F|nr:hypothetical protein [Halobacillus sp. BAB-2008]ELK44150.1 hypothetical protein D479_20218 [Halobacillus sp. BAB-2008]
MPYNQLSDEKIIGLYHFIVDEVSCGTLSPLMLNEAETLKFVAKKRGIFIISSKEKISDTHYVDFIKE